MLDTGLLAPVEHRGSSNYSSPSRFPDDRSSSRCPSRAGHAELLVVAEPVVAELATINAGHDNEAPTQPRTAAASQPVTDDTTSGTAGTITRRSHSIRACGYEE